MPASLEGVRVIDFGQYIAGPLAAMVLADAGADVIRIDPPGGPRWQNPANAILQRGKRSLSLDLQKPGDLQIALRLISSADIVIENFRPGVMDRLGLGGAAMTAANSRLIYCSLPGFGRDDPRAPLAGWEGIVSAAAGLYRQPAMMPGTPEVLFNPTPLASTYGAAIACHAVVAALIARLRFGGGEHIEVPLFGAAMQVIGLFGLSAPMPMPAGLMPVNPAFMIKRRPCADGRYIDMSPPIRSFDWFAEYFLKPFDDEAPGLARRADPEAIERLGAMLDKLYETYTAADLEREAQERAGCAVALCQSQQEWLTDIQARQTQCCISQFDHELGQTLQAGYAVHLTKTPLTAAGPRRQLDSDRAEILRTLRQEGEQSSSPALARQRLPLEGVRIVDTTQLLAGPTATKILAEYGADVIKINDPRPNANPMGAVGHADVNRGKRSLLLDLTSPDGRDMLLDLIASADVFHQNFSHDGAIRLGFGEEAARDLNPMLIYSSVSAHAYGGFRGPYRGHEELGQAVTGMQALLGGSGGPRRAGWAVNDYGTGHLSALGILLALYHRYRTGDGQHVQAALSRTATMLQVPHMLDFEGRSWSESLAEVDGWGPLNMLYQAADRIFFLSADQPDAQDRLCELEGFSSVRDLDGSKLQSALADIFLTRDAAEWVTQLRLLGLAAHELRTVEENMEDPINVRLGVSVLQHHEAAPPTRAVGAWARFSGPMVRQTSAAPPLGWDTRTIVMELGRSPHYSELLADGVVRAADVDG